MSVWSYISNIWQKIFGSGNNSMPTPAPIPVPFPVSPTPTPTPPSPVPPSPPVLPPINKVKPPVVGVTSMGDTSVLKTFVGYPVNDFSDIKSLPNQYAGQVCNFTWGQLNPSSGTYDFSAIDSCIAMARQLKTLIEIRVFQGPLVPSWVIDATGPVTIYNKRGGSPTVTMAKIWTDTYMNAVAEFVAKLASVYDTNPTVKTFWAMGGNASFTDELFNVGGLPEIRKQWSEAGMTDALSTASIEQVIPNNNVWKYTQVGAPVSSFQSVDNPEAPTTNEFSMQFAQNYINAFGPLGVLANMAFNSSKTSGSNYELLKSLSALCNTNNYLFCGQEVGSATNNGNVSDDVTFMASLGVTEFQAWPQRGSNTYTAADMEKWTMEMVSNAKTKNRM